MEANRDVTAEKRVTTKRILIYVGITFLITYAFEFLLIYPAVLGDNPILSQSSALLVAGAMFVPALGVLLTRLITKEGFKDAWLKPNFRGHIRYYVFGWFGPAVLTLIGMVIYFLIFPDKYDGNMTYLRSALAVTGQEYTTEMLKITMMVQVATALFLGPLLNAITCFGEEWGWRGYLLPKMMEKLPIGWVLLINGVIWGLWHAPLTAIGHNYGLGYKGWPVTGIVAMCGFCIVMGTIFSYITIKTGSCLPAVLAHGSLNGMAAIGISFTVDEANPFIGPVPTGIIGGSAFLVIAMIMAVLLLRKKVKE